MALWRYGDRPNPSLRATGAACVVIYATPSSCSAVELVIGEASPVGVYPGSLFKFTLYFAEVLHERGSAPGRGPTSMGSETVQGCSAVTSPNDLIMVMTRTV